MFLVKFILKTSCYFLDGIFRVALLVAIIFVASNHAESVLAHVQDVSEKAVQKIETVDKEEVKKQLDKGLAIFQ